LGNLLYGDISPVVTLVKKPRMGGLTKHEVLFYNREQPMIAVRCRDPSGGESTCEVRLLGHILVLSHLDTNKEV